MAPTLKVGRVVNVVEDPAYVPKIGDIVVFHPPAGALAVPSVCGNPQQGAGHSQACSMPTTPKETSQRFIKRVVAGPGDTIAIKNGHVVRNGQVQEEPYITPCGQDPSCSFPMPITIPPGEYFVLGDNRGASDDSRFWGPIRREWIVGKVKD